jgi:hypothetical protein
VNSVSDLRQRDVLTDIGWVACGGDAVKPHGLVGASVKARNVVVRSTSGEEEVCGSCPTDLAKGLTASWMLANCCTNDGWLTLSASGEGDN